MYGGYCTGRLMPSSYCNSYNLMWERSFRIEMEHSDEILLGNHFYAPSRKTWTSTSGCTAQKPEIYNIASNLINKLKPAHHADDCPEILSRLPNLYANRLVSEGGKGHINLLKYATLSTCYHSTLPLTFFQHFIMKSWWDWILGMGMGCCWVGW